MWLEVQKWLEVSSISPPNMFAHWRCWDGMVSPRKELKRGMRLIWHTVVWVIWSVRNNVIFNNGVIDVGEEVEDIKRLSWRWSLSRLNIQPCLFYEWHWNPQWCLEMLHS